jgi:flavin-binding protein dodecin
MFHGQKHCNNFRIGRHSCGGSLSLVFKYIDILGESAEGFDGAVQNAIEETARTVKDIRTAEVLKLNVIVSNDKIVEYQAVMRVSFKVKR